MSKRAAEHSGGGGAPLKGGHRPEEESMDVDERDDVGEFEDEFEDEFESDDEILEAGVDGRPDAEREAEERSAAMDLDGHGGQDTFIVGRTKLEPGQTLAPDPSTYEMLHNLSTPWPCLSFDVLRDGLGDDRKVYPATMYAVTGTQAQSARARENELLVMKFSGLGRMDRDDGSESGDDDDDDEEETDPVLESKAIPLTSTTNRIRAYQITGSQTPSKPGDGRWTATMTESDGVLIHDITPHVSSLDRPGVVVTAQQNKPLHRVRAHRTEGYAVDWSPSHAAGRLLTGDNDGLVYVTTGAEGGSFVTDNRAFQGHSGSVEEVQWSPSEASVFASASSDGTVRVWDVRSKSRKPAITMRVSQADVNVLSWSRRTTHLLASGADDGVWAARAKPVASFDYHKEQVTSVEWHPTDDSIVAVAAADNTVTLWDLAVELDDEESRDTAGVQDVPPQLLFVHYHANAKEVHWHPQMLGALVATGDEFSIFRTISV